MAFSNVTLQDARLNAVNSMFAVNNQRIPSFEAISMLLEGAVELLPGIAEIRQSSTQVTEAVVMSRVAPGEGTTRKCSPSGTGTPQLQAITWATILEEMSLNDVEHQGSQVKYQQAFDYLYPRKAENMYTRLLSAIMAALDANASTVNAGTYFPAINVDVKTIPYQQREDIFNGVAAEMMDNKYFGRYNIIGNYNFNAWATRVKDQGTGNSVNLQAFSDQFRFAHGPVTNEVGMSSTFYVFAPGTIGLILWIRPDFRQGVSRPNSGVKTTTRLPPVFGLPNGLLVEVKYDEHCEGEAEFVEGWGYSIDHAEVVAFDEDAGSTPIFKYQVEQVPLT